MTGRDNPLWLRCWQEENTGDFHQASVNRFLPRYWPSLDCAAGSRVFVPMCGKSLDMIWLAQQGHSVIGVELSPIAVRDFFRENKLQPTRRKLGQFTLWQDGKLGILCGDYFALTAAVLGPVNIVYDRAALTALPPDLRKRYVAHLFKIVSPGAQILLLTTEYAEANEPLSRIFGIDEEIDALYAADFDVKLTCVESVFESDPRLPEQMPARAEDKVYRLSAKRGGKQG